jgi:glycosyltransferase involved in cell wall biosynthesis
MIKKYHNPTVSIIIPVYNRQDLIVRTLNSVLSQDFEDYEIIVVDDSSTDDTKSVVMKIGDERIVYIEHEKNKGANVARNTGIMHAKGKYVAFLDSDDEWLPEKLKKQVEKIEATAEKVGVVYCGYWIALNGKKFIGHVPKKREDIFLDELLGDCVSPTSCVLIKKECFDAVGGFDKNMPARQDYEMWLRIAREFHFEYVKDPLSIIYFDDDSRRISLSGAEKHIQAEEMLLQKYKTDIEKQSRSIQKKIYSMHYLVLGRRCWYNGDSRRARGFFMKAISIHPVNMQCLFLFFASFFGNRCYHLLSYFARMMRMIRIRNHSYFNV